jgi:nucleotidyltransferase/DNA polymerase involved in DNA repair
MSRSRSGPRSKVTGLNASAGISYNKFLAKLASDHRKPNGQYVITPEMGPAFVEALPVGKFHGIGPATSAKMNSLGLHTGLDMRNQTLEFMQANFGKAGAYYYYWISRGIDDREVRANRIRKSVGAENTFPSDLTEFDAMVAELQLSVGSGSHSGAPSAAVFAMDRRRSAKTTPALEAISEGKTNLTLTPVFAISHRHQAGNDPKEKALSRALTPRGSL